MQRTAANGRLIIPESWPKWKLRCHAVKKNGEQCKQWSVTGMPTCKTHGSGGERNRQLGQMRYLAWIIIGGPQTLPVEPYCRVALAAAFEMLVNQGKGSVEQQLKAALWLTDNLAQ